MSVVHKKLTAPGAFRDQWVLRDPDGAQHGPLDLSTLCEWSAQGRVLPGSEVSTDGQEWMPAGSIPELRLEWMSQLADGSSYGPFNLLAVPHLCANGTISSNSVLANRVSGKTLNVQELLKPRTRPPDQAPVASPQELLSAARRELDEETARRKVLEAQGKHAQQKLRSEVEQLQNELAAVKERLKTAASNQAEEKKRARQQADEAAEREARLAGRAEELEQSLKLAESEAEGARARLSEWAKRSEDDSCRAEEHERFLSEQIELVRKKAETELAAAAADAKEARKLAASIESARAESERQQAETRAALLREMDSVRSAKTRIEQDLAALKERELKLQTQAEESTRLLGELKDQLASHEEACDRARTGCASAEREAEAARLDCDRLRSGYEAKLSELGEKNQDLTGQVEHLQAENSEQKGQLALKTDEARRLDAEKRSLSVQVESALHKAASLEALRGEMTREHAEKDAALRREIQALRLAKDQAEQEAASAREQAARLEQESRRSVQTTEALKKEASMYQSRLEHAERSASDFSGEIKAEREREEKLRAEYEEKLRETTGHDREMAAHFARAQTENARLKAALEEKEQAERSARIELAATIAEVEKGRKTIAELESGREQESARAAETLKEEVSTYREKLERAEKMLAEREARLESDSARERESAAGLARLESEKAALAEELARNEKALRKAERSIAACEKEKQARERGEPASRPLLTSMGMAAALMLISAVAGFLLGGMARTSGRPAAGREAPPELTLAAKVEKQEPGAQSAPAAARTTSPVSAPAAVAAPRPERALRGIVIPHATVTHTSDGCSVVFEDGIFSFMTNLADSAESSLAAAAAALRPFMRDYDMTIEGHADMVPVSSKASYTDNYALGLARASTALGLMKTKFNLPAHCMRISSTGTNDPPYSNEDSALRRKNRTVVLKLVKRRPGAAKPE